MAAELEAQRRQQFVLEVRFAARTEALEERRGEDRRRHRLVNGGLDRPTPFAGVGNSARELRQRGILDERRCGQIEQPGGDDAAAPPYFRDVAQVEVKLVMLRIAQRRRL